MGKMKAAAAAADERSPDFIVPDLTPQQKEMRSKGLGGSDSERIMSGDWYLLWAEKSKRVVPEDLSRVLDGVIGKKVRRVCGIKIADDANRSCFHVLE